MALSLIAQPDGATVPLPGAERLHDNFRDDNVHESTVFPGLLLLAGLVALAWVRSRTALALAVTSVILWVLTLGPSLKVDGNYLWTGSDGEPVGWLPFRLLIEFPGMGSLRAANRASYALAAVLAACLALSLGHLYEKMKTTRARVLLGGGCCLLLLPSLIVPLKTSSLSVSPEVEAALHEIDDRSKEQDSVLLVPADCQGETMWDVPLQIRHQTPWVGCMTSASALFMHSKLDLYAESPELAGLRCDPGAIGRRRTSFDGTETFESSDLGPLREQLDVRFLILDKTLLDLPRCKLDDGIIAELGTFEVLGEDERFLVVDTLGPGTLERVLERD